MQIQTKKLLCSVFLALLLAVLLAVSPLCSQTSHASPLTTWTGITTGWANVRSVPETDGRIVATYAPKTRVVVYETVTGQAAWSGNTTWYRVSDSRSASRYVYGSLVVRASEAMTVSHEVAPTAPAAKGKSILVSLSRQWMYAYENGHVVYSAAVTTGQPALATPTGTYHVYRKLSPTTFYSPFPPSSPYWYEPTPINYALEWKGGGFFLHDATWRSVFGPGTNVPHQDPVYGQQTGTHGCVNMPLDVAAWLYRWTPVGTEVQINA